MTRRHAYVAVFTLALSTAFVAGNPSVSETARSLSTYPSLLSVLLIPVVLGVLLWDYARRGHSPAEVWTEGRRISLWASAAFALVAAVFSLGLFWQAEVGYDLHLAAFGAASTFALTYALGAVSAAGWARVLGAPAFEGS